MDVSFYISELLTKHGEISVPGLGYLVKAYVPGHYNEADGKFYPPHYLVQFDPQQLDDDDTLTQYIADVKNISLESSKYFTDKFITEIRENAFIKDVAIADLGWFYTEQGRLLFRPTSAIDNDPAFFGYAPISLKRIGEASVPPPQTVQEPEINLPPIQDFSQPTPPPPVFDRREETPAAEFTPPPVSEVSRKQALIDEFNARNKAAIADEQAAAASQQPYRAAEEAYVAPQQEEQYEDDEIHHSRPWGLIILFSVIIVLALAFLGVYKFAPTRYEAAKAWFQKTIGHKSATDTAKTKSAGATATLPPKVDAATADSIKQARFADSIKQANTADSLAKAKIVDDKKTAAQRKVDSVKKVREDKLAAQAKIAADKKAAAIRKADSIKQVAAARIVARAKTADSLKQIKAARIAAKAKTADSLKQIKAAIAAAAKAGKGTVVLKPTNVPVKQAPTVAVPDKKVKPVADVPVKQKTTVVKEQITDANAKQAITPAVKEAAASGSLKPVDPDPTKSWLTIAKDCTSTANALATINKLKQLGINAFVAHVKGTKIRVATQAYNTNEEADAASSALKAKGFPDAYLIPINQQK